MGVRIRFHRVGSLLPAWRTIAVGGAALVVGCASTWSFVASDPAGAAAQRASASASSLSSSRSASAADRSTKLTKARWQHAVDQAPKLGQGCYRATYPSTQWHATTCKAAPEIPFAPTHVSAAEKAAPAMTVGNGLDDSAVVNGTISSATGSFADVTPAVTEVGQFDGGLTPTVGTAQFANTYSLQLNSEFFSGSPACDGAAASGLCEAWQQFVYSSYTGYVFIQYWLIRYDTTCPGGWNQYTTTVDHITDCYATSAAITFPGGRISAANLASTTLTGSASSGGNDVETLTSGGTSVAISGPDSKVDLAPHWNTAEFNVFGDAAGGSATFGSGTTLESKVALTGSSPTPPTCVVEGFTAETNNLNLTATTPIGLQPSPTMVFAQTDTAGKEATAACETTGASKLVFTTEPPSGTFAGTPFTVGVSIEKPTGTVLTTKSTTVALAISAGPGSATLTCTSARDKKDAASGVATFSCKIGAAGTGFVLRATSGAVTATSTPFDLVLTLIHSKFAITTQPGSAGLTQIFRVGVSIEDAQGIVIPTAATWITLAITPGSTGAVLTCTGATTDGHDAIDGVATFDCSITKMGSYKLQARSGSNSTPTPATTNVFTIAAAPPPPVHSTTGGSPPTPPSGTGTSHTSCSVASGTCHATNDSVTVTGFAGPGALTVSQYSSDPESAPTFTSTGEYFDVALASGSSFSTVTVKDCSLSGGTKLYWWNAPTSRWEPVTPVAGPTGTPPCITATLSSTSSPTLSQLTGTVFAVGTPAAPSTATTRVAGATADATAAAEFQRTFPSTKGTCPASRAAVVATTAEYNDALSSQFLAQSLTTGTLLTPTKTLSPVTAATLEAEGITKVYVVGGPLAITTTVVKAIEALTADACGGKTPSGKITVDRIAGTTQYGTAEAIAEHVGTAASLAFPGAYATTNAAGGTGKFNDTAGLGSAAPTGALPTAILASGVEFQDAQAASVISYRTKLPLLLTPAATLSTTAVAAIGKLGVKQVILMGGTLAITNTVEAALVAKTGVAVLRVAGKDYTDTAVELARFEAAGKTTGLSWTPGHKVLVARGNGFTDGIAGAVLDSPANTATGPKGTARPLVLTETPTVVGTFLTTFLKTTGAKGIDGTAAKTITSFTVLGGPLALTTAVVTQMETDLKG